MDHVTRTELELLGIFYLFADEFGRVDMQQARLYALKKFGVWIPDVPFTIQQEHIDLLMDQKMVPDTREIMGKAATP
jgi:hypothetical protein